MAQFNVLSDLNQNSVLIWKNFQTSKNIIVSNFFSQIWFFSYFHSEIEKNDNVKFVEREILLQKTSKSKILLFRIPNFSIVFELEPKNETVLEPKNEKVQQIVYYNFIFIVSMIQWRRLNIIPISSAYQCVHLLVYVKLSLILVFLSFDFFSSCCFYIGTRGSVLWFGLNVQWLQGDPIELCVTVNGRLEQMVGLH